MSVSDEEPASSGSDVAGDSVLEEGSSDGSVSDDSEGLEETTGSEAVVLSEL